MPEGVDLASLSGAVRQLLREHVEALRDPPTAGVERPLRLASRLEADLDGPLAEALRALAPQGVAGPPDTRELPGFLEDIERAAGGVLSARKRVAAGSALKRLTEASGLLFTMQQKLHALEQTPPEGPEAVAAAAIQWADLHARLREAAAGLEEALDRWASAGAEPEAQPVDLAAALRRARGLLGAGSERAARLELARALEAQLASKAWGRAEAGRFEEALAAWERAGARLPSPPDAVRGLHRALLVEAADPLVAWRLFDATEAFVNRADMMPWPEAPEGANRNP